MRDFTKLTSAPDLPELEGHSDTDMPVDRVNITGTGSSMSTVPFGAAGTPVAASTAGSPRLFRAGRSG